MREVLSIINSLRAWGTEGEGTGRGRRGATQNKCETISGERLCNRTNDCTWCIDNDYQTSCILTSDYKQENCPKTTPNNSRPAWFQSQRDYKGCRPFRNNTCELSDGRPIYARPSNKSLSDPNICCPPDRDLINRGSRRSICTCPNYNQSY